MSTRYVYAMKIETTNDSSGNPRRGWLVYGAGQGSLLGFADENYDSYRAVFERVCKTLKDEKSHNQYDWEDVEWEVIELGIVEVPAKEYRTARKHRQL